MQSNYAITAKGDDMNIKGKLLIGMCGAFTMLLAGCSSSDPCERDTEAFVISKDFVKRQLKSPSTADFPSFSDSGVHVSPMTTSDGKCGFRIQLYVDAQNSFGGTAREYFTVTVTPDGGGSWSLVSIN